MKQKLTVIVHKFNKSLLLVKSQSDLSTLLGISISTIKRNYNEVGIYDTATYTVYVGAQYYDNGIESKYRHDVEPPVVKTYLSIKSPTITNNIDIVSHSNRVIEHIIEEEPIETDWRITEKNLSIGEYDKYYSTRTLEQLSESSKYFKMDQIRIKYISKYGERLLID